MKNKRKYCGGRGIYQEGVRRSPGHYYPVSRDWEDIDCRAIGCMYNKDMKCMVPSLCKIGGDGKCTGFTTKPFEPKEVDINGD